MTDNGVTLALVTSDAAKARSILAEAGTATGS